MVYRGKPSTGCKKCRQRKIKCDERPGGCRKCADKDFVCPGYETTLDLFRDESASVQVKAERSKAKAIIAREEREKRNVLDKLKNTMGATIMASMMDEAITFFMVNYAWGLERPSVQSKYYGQHLSTHGFHPIIATCITALGLAGVANIWMDPGLKQESTKWYMTALKMTNKAIADPAQVKSDNTLLATMMLSVFEATNNEVSLMGWVKHVIGSASLLRTRGRNQFSTAAGRRMWLQIVSLITIQCMGMGEPIPDFVHAFNQEVLLWENNTDPATQFFHLHIAAIELRAQILKKRLTDLHVIVDLALELDETAKHVFDNADNDWNYEVEQCEPGTPGVFGTYYHIYPRLSVAQTWDWIRYTRIYINDIIRNSLIAGFTSTPPVFSGIEYMRMLETATETLYQLQGDILASMPQYLHDTPQTPLKDQPPRYSNSLIDPTVRPSPPPPSPFSRIAAFPSPSSPQSINSSHAPKLFISNFRDQDQLDPQKWGSPPELRDQLPIIRVSGGYSSLWALYIAGATPIASPESQEYVMETLTRASREFGINQAKILAGALKVKIDFDKGVAMDARISGGVGGGMMGIAPIYMPTNGPHVE